jgi:NAD(P)-dependent dehydrogenase (short-subunit alcohol dehydrogenase family)
MPQRLKDKVVIVTGGTSGIGLASAQLFAQEGARVTATGSSKESVQQAQQVLGGSVDVLVSDARNATDIEALIAHVVERHGGIDVLFVNAGRPLLAPIDVMDEAGFDHMLDVNLKGPWLTLRAAFPHLRRGGSVIFNTSIANVSASPGLSAYGAAKAGLRAFSRYAAAELVSRGVRVNSLSPGPIATPAVAKMPLPKEQQDFVNQMLLDSVPMKRMGTPEEAAEVALFLASEASSFVTGSSEVTVDGGATLN